MQLSGKTLSLSATDLVGHINCRYLTQLDLKVARGTLPKPDPTLEVSVERGRRHERAYLDHLASQGRQVTTIAGVGIDPAALAAQGAPVIAQAALQSGQWSGRAIARACRAVFTLKLSGRVAKQREQ